jgi:hypothetical protein
MHIKQTFVLTLLTAMLLIGGCASRPVVSFRTVADLDHAFVPISEAPVRVMVWRHDDGEAADSGEASGAGRIVPTAQLTLEERNFLAGVQAGFARAGFEVVHADASPAYAVLAAMDTATGVYDSYRRVPVIESTTGYVHTHHGLRSYTATTSSDYIVPEKHPYVRRIITVSALPSNAATDGGALSPKAPGVVWRGCIVSDADVIDSDLAHHVATLLESWGANAQRDVKYKPAKG